MSDRDYIQRVKNSKEAEDFFVNWGYHEYPLNKEDLKHLLNKGYIVIHDGEYSHGVYLDCDNPIQEINYTSYWDGYKKGYEDNAR